MNTAPHDESTATLRRRLAHDLRTPIAALLAVEGQVDTLPHDVRSLLREAICRLQALADRHSL